MIQLPIVREPRIIKEEINDLQAYLDGIPAELKEAGAFASYEHRMADLATELILSDLLYLNLAKKTLPEARLPALSGYEEIYHAIEKGLRQMERAHKRAADRYASATRLLQFSLLAVLVGVVLDPFVPALTYAFPLGTIGAVIAAALSFLGFSNKIRREERLADSYMALRDTLAHVLTPSGTIMGQAKYYEDSTKRIEELIQRIKSEPNTS